MKLIEKFNQIETIAELEDLNIGKLYIDISCRGGQIGFHSCDVGAFIGINDALLPNMVGAYCNYLGGGMRGTIVGSNYSEDVPQNKRQLLDAVINACKRVYLNIENDLYLNDEEDEDGETNWDAIATNKARNGGIVSAY